MRSPLEKSSMKTVLLAALCVGLTGCYAEATTDPGPVVVGSSTGFLTVDWSISGYQDPVLCAQSDADVISVAIETSDGFFVGEFQDVCEAFVTSIELDPDAYVGDAVLLDPDGFERTTPVDLGFFEIFGDDELVIPVDFPPDSFF
jgi:hypothetical protein